MDVESFSKTKAMELPRNVVVGHDAIHQVGEVCASLKLGKRALMVADETTMKIAGAAAVKDLGTRKIKTSEFLIPDATWDEVVDAEQRIRKGNLDFALGVGGGELLPDAPEREQLFVGGAIAHRWLAQQERAHEIDRRIRERRA